LRNPFPDYPDGTARLFKLIRNKKGAITTKTKTKKSQKKKNIRSFYKAYTQQIGKIWIKWTISRQDTIYQS
jgi:hypothetical protein